jgi:two-component system, chemotaxis family, chemotaxis protein CheY
MDGKGRGKLLLVEDENLLRRLIAEFLRSEGFEVIEAADGLEGAGIFTGQGPFDLVLLDLNLPLLSGVDVCRQIKTRHPLQPVLICSAAILDDHMVALHALNVDQFLTKPYHPLDLLDRITYELSRSLLSGGDRNHRSQSTASWAPKTSSRSIPQPSNPGQASSVGLR